MRRAARIDDNQPEIMRVLRDMGAHVIDCSGVGQGYPDLNVVYRRQIAYVEVKDGSKSPSRRALTPDQVRFHAECSLHGVKVRIVETVDDAVNLIRELRG